MWFPRKEFQELLPLKNVLMVKTLFRWWIDIYRGGFRDSLGWKRRIRIWDVESHWTRWNRIMSRNCLLASTNMNSGFSHMADSFICTFLVERNSTSVYQCGYNILSYCTLYTANMICYKVMVHLCGQQTLAVPPLSPDEPKKKTDILNDRI